MKKIIIDNKIRPLVLRKIMTLFALLNETQKLIKKLLKNKKYNLFGQRTRLISAMNE